MRSRLALLAGLTTTLALRSAGAASADLANDVHTLLEQRCYKCHGPNRSENGLRLDVQDQATTGGEHGPAWVPGKSSDSLILQVVSGSHSELPRMPRKGEPLSPDQIALLKSWVDAGAPWPKRTQTATADPKQHWAFQPVKRPQLPRSNPTSEPPGPIDSLVESRLAREGLVFSPPADRSALLRRLSLDLIGLPPTSEEVDAFVADTSSDAYTKVVERLLASPHYGEKWGRHWLDSARYADSNGFEKDRTRSIWPYRDWVIHALNEDLAFDEFTRDQLAGDLLADGEPNLPAERQQSLRIATGFLRNSMVNMEGGIEPEKFRTETIIDRVDAVSRTWLGLTVACAQCHNHKYDPISQKEYYQFYDFLNQDVEPRLDVPSEATRAKRHEIVAAARTLESELRARPEVETKFSAWLTEQTAKHDDWQALNPNEWHSTPMKFEKQEDFSLLGGGDIYNSSVLRVWVDVPHTNITGFRLETLNHGNLPNGGPGLDGKGDFLIGEFMVDAMPAADFVPANSGTAPTASVTNRIKFIRAEADAEADGFPASAMIDGVTTNGGWASAFTAGRRNQERRAVFVAEQPFGFPGGTRLLLTVHSKLGDDLQGKNDKVSNFIPGRVRLSLTTNSESLHADSLSESQRQRIAQAAGSLTPELRSELFRVFLFHEPSLADAARQWDELWKDWPTAENTTLALQNRPTPRQTRIFKRGDWQKPSTPVTADVPAILNPFPVGAPRNRLGLAQWLTSADNPLTARVIVNRVWQQYFGRGLVEAPEDFGVRSPAPSNPELLDWLAAEFMGPRVSIPAESPRPWSLKHLHRLIVNSRTYQQSSRVTPELLERDPYNHFLARGPRFRVDAEGVQDIALKVSGLLSPKVGGPSVFPPLPDGVMGLAYGPIPWNVSEGDDRYRRAMYTFWKRSVPYPAMMTFDAPTAEQSCVRRVRSNTPLQALVTLNEPTFHQAARWLAWRALAAHDTDQARATWAFRQCVSRVPTDQERVILLRLLDEARREFEMKSKEAAQFALSDPKSPPPLPANTTVTDLAAWTSVTRAILNLDETLTKE
ncbi:MAG TPA: PSD1 and planctomycete cytochrome C domain-containing protein [Verrucomicrobiota bacterium]|nr:hypothetical protein [Verrucomicrobiales bacterium]HRI13254.1 PSD1 and planctomycete cytochrome C domain-containing protein [Verrucomicrobiota bacterium]